MAMSTASNLLWNFLLAFFTPFIVCDIDFRYGYGFAGCLLLAAAVVYFFVMEGQGRTRIWLLYEPFFRRTHQYIHVYYLVEELDTMYLLRINPRESNKLAAPPPEELATTEQLVRGASGAPGTDIERNGGIRAPEIAPSPAATYNE